MNPANPYGVDFLIARNAAGQLDADPSMRTTTGRALLTQSLLSRVSTPRGSVVDCPNDCLDLRSYVSTGMTYTAILALCAQVQTELLKDQRVYSAVVNGQYNTATSTLTLPCSIQSSMGPFTFTLAVTSVTVSILNSNLPAGS
jgi:hypothetical protein